MPVPVALSFRRTPVTLVLSAWMIALEAYCVWFGQEEREAIYNQYLGISFAIWDGAWWRPLTSAFLHGDPLHLAFNLLMFVLFGSWLEAWMRWWKFLLLVVYLAYVSMLPEFVILNYFWEPGTGYQSVVGFSGVGYGLFGFLMVGRRYHPQFHEVCTPQIAMLMSAWFFICIALTVLDLYPVANIAHGMGWLLGALLAQAVFVRENTVLWLAVLAAASLVVFSTMFYVWNHPGYAAIQQQKAVRRLSEQLQMEARESDVKATNGEGAPHNDQERNGRAP